MSHSVEIAIRGIDEASRVFENVGSQAEQSIKMAESSVNDFDQSVSSVSDLDVSTGQTESAMNSASEAVSEVESSIQQAEETGVSFGERMKGVFDNVAEKWVEITAVAGTAGAGLEAFSRKQGDVNAAFDRTAIATGYTSDQLRQMAVDMADTTTNTDQQAEAFEMLVQRGIDTEEQFRDIIPHVSNLGTATGQDLQPALESADRLLKPFGQNLDDLGDNVDQMARIMMQTDIPLSALERNLGRVPDELAKLEFGLDDAAAGIQVFRDRGFEGREAVRNFRRAVDNSEGDMTDFLDILGLTTDEWEEYQKAVEPQAGLVEDIANANENNMTVMEKLQENVSNLMVEYGAFADLGSMLAPILISLGPIIKGVSSAVGVFNAVMAANPIVLIIGAIIALIAVIALLWRNWEEVTEFLSNSWAWIKNLATEHFGALGDYLLEFWSWVKEIAVMVWESIAEFFTEVWEWITEIFFNTLDNINDFLSEAWNEFYDITVGALEAVLEFIDEIFLKIFNVIWGFLDWFNDITDGKFSDVVDTIKRFMNMADEIFTATLDFWMETFKNGLDFIKALLTLDFQGMKDAISNQMSNISGYLSNVWGSISGFIGGTVGNIRDSISSSFNNIRDTISSVWDGVKNTTSRVWNSMVDVVKAPINLIISAINGMINGLNSVKISSPKIPSWVPKYGGKGFEIGFNIPNVPSLATGGVVSRPTLAMVGDAGYGNPEIVAPQKMIAQIIGTELKNMFKHIGNTEQVGQPKEIIVPVYIDGREVARVTAPYIDRNLGDRKNRIDRARGG